MIFLKSFYNKVIYLAPHSPMTLALKNYLEVKNINVKGFIDKNKEDTNIIKIDELANREFDYIFLYHKFFVPNFLLKLPYQHILYFEQ